MGKGQAPLDLFSGKSQITNFCRCSIGEGSCSVAFFLLAPIRCHIGGSREGVPGGGRQYACTMSTVDATGSGSIHSHGDHDMAQPPHPPSREVLMLQGLPPPSRRPPPLRSRRRWRGRDVVGCCPLVHISPLLSIRPGRRLWM
jgi:hypothetical protein